MFTYRSNTGCKISRTAALSDAGRTVEVTPIPTISEERRRVFRYLREYRRELAAAVNRIFVKKWPSDVRSNEVAEIVGIANDMIDLGFQFTDAFIEDFNMFVPLSLEIFLCPRCDRIARSDNSSDVDGDAVCESCAQEACHCHYCDTSTFDNMIPDYRNRDVCESCQEDGSIPDGNDYWYPDRMLFTTECGRTLVDGDSCDCDACCPPPEDDKFIKPYHHQRSQKHRSAGRYAVGFELEVHTIGNHYREDVAEDLHGEIELLRTEEDSSLDSSKGFEIITPHGDISFATATARTIVSTINGRCISHDAERPHGLHINLSRYANEDEYVDLFVAFWNDDDNWNVLKKFARRNSNRFCKSNNVQRHPVSGCKCKYTYIKEKHSRINVLDNRIEVRAFRGTLKADTLVACIELAYYSWEFIRSIDLDGSAEVPTFAEFLAWLVAQHPDSQVIVKMGTFAIVS